jgi:hypothetical protein
MSFDADWRKDFLAVQARDLDAIFSLTAGEAETRATFERLAADTVDGLLAAEKRALVAFSIEPDSAFCFVSMTWLHGLVAPEIVERWRRWAADYPALLGRNPRLDLRDALSWCSETHNASSFPYGWEGAVFDWVSADDIDAKPRYFDDRMGIIDAAFYGRLRRLLAAMDGGWLAWSEPAGRVVYVAADEWRAIHAERTAERKKVRREIAAGCAADPAFATRIAEIRRQRGKT